MDTDLTTLPWYFTTDNETNGTIWPERPEKLYRAYNIMIGVTVAFIMFCMGCGLTWDVILPHLKKPVGPIIGMVCQLIVLPAISFGMAHAFGFDGELAIGVIIMGSAPGGAVSNIFSYWSYGDLGLSVTMTTFSSTLALGFLPLNMFMYTRSWVDQVNKIPYLEMFFTVLYTWVAAVLGMIVGWKAPKPGSYIAKVGSIVGFILIIVCGIIQGELYPEIVDVHWSVRVCAVIVPLIGFGLGVGLAMAACLTYAQARTIGFETGMQNAAVALTMISLAYDQKEASKYVQYPLLYAVFMMIEGFIISILHRIIIGVKYRRLICYKKKDKRSKNLEYVSEDMSDISSVASFQSYKSTGNPQVDMDIGKFKRVKVEFAEYPDGYTGGIISSITIGEDSQTKAKELEAHQDEKVQATNGYAIGIDNSDLENIDSHPVMNLAKNHVLEVDNPAVDFSENIYDAGTHM